MENWCVFCGESIPDGQLTCNLCACIVEDLTPEQQRAFAELIRDAESREKLHAEMNKIKEQTKRAFEGVCAILRDIAEKICNALQKEG